MAPRLAFLLLLLAVAESSAMGSAASEVQWGLTRIADGDAGLVASTPTCDGLLGECFDEDNELGVESDEARRFLFGAAADHQRFISYGALNRNRVPCNRRGQSYYNCNKSGRANPYRRGCSVITRCARILD